MITGEQLLQAVSTYNQAIWPMQIIGYVLALITVVLAFKKTIWASRINFAVLSFFWLWVALMYWLPSAGPAFPIGYAFLVLFLIEGVFFLIQAVRGNLTFGTYNKGHTIAGLSMILYTMLAYPLLAILLGHPYPQASLVGLTPCPLTLFTFGLLLLTSSAVPIILLIIPLFWGLSGVLWISIGMWEDVGMVLGVLVAFVLILRRNRKLKTEEETKDQDTSSEAWSLNVGGQSQGVYRSRQLGTLFFMLGLILWLAKGDRGSIVLRAILIGLFIGNTLGFILSLIGQLTVQISALGWVGVLSYLVLALGFSYILIKKNSS